MRIACSLTLLVVGACANSRSAAPVGPTPAPVAEPKAGTSTYDACESDETRTWKRALRDRATHAAALERLGKLSTAELSPLLPMLIEMSRGFPVWTSIRRQTYDDYERIPGIERRAEYLEIIARLKDPATIPLFIEALEYSDETYEHALVAVNFLRDMKSAEAVGPLIRVLENRLPVGSRANRVRRAAMRALAVLGDARAVPALIQILTTPANEQDCLLNQNAALALAVLSDVRAVPALVQGMYLTAKGVDMFQACRLALVSIGSPAVHALLPLSDPTSPDSVALAKRLGLDRLPARAAIVLGDLGAAEAGPALVAAWKRLPSLDKHEKPPLQGDSDYWPWVFRRDWVLKEGATILRELGRIADRTATNTLISVLKDKDALAAFRAAAARALVWTGEPRVISELLAVALSSKSPPKQAPDKGEPPIASGRTRDPDLRLVAVTAAVHLAPLDSGKKIGKALDRLVRRDPKSEGLKSAQEGLAAIEKCVGDLACLARILTEPASGPAEAAAFALAYAKDKKAALEFLIDGMRPVVTLPKWAFQRHRAVLFGLRRLGDKTSTDCLAKLDRMIEHDEDAVRLPGSADALDLLAEERITAALMRRKE